MGIEYQVESLDGLDESIAKLYVENDGKYTLDVAGVVPKSQFDEVNQKAVDNATEAARRRKTIERVTGKLGLENADGLDDALEALINGKGKKSEDQEQIIAQIKAQAAKDIEAAQAEVQNLLIGGGISQLQAALQAAGFNPKVAEMLAKTNKERLVVDESRNLRIMGDNGKPLAGSGADGYANMTDLAKEFAAAMPELLTDTGKGGGGKPPASGGADSTGKTVTRSKFDAMSQHERAEFSKTGGKVVDG